MEKQKCPSIGSWEREILTSIPEGLDLFYSKSLWKPYGNKGAFGGQLFSQGIHAMMLTVEKEFLLSSCNSHYILSVDITKKILYKVTRIRDGTYLLPFIIIGGTFCSRSVIGIQDGKTVFESFGTFKRYRGNSNAYQV